MFRVSLGVFFLLLVFSVSNAAAPKAIRVVCFDVYGTGEAAVGPKNLLRCLGPDLDVQFKTFTGDEIRGDALASCDVLICPGGSGSRQAKVLNAAGRDIIRSFVRKGGGYVGICAGAYLASAQYDWSLGLLDARVADTAHWARGMGDVTLGLTPGGMGFLGTNAASVVCYYAQGPLLIPGTNRDRAPFETQAMFLTEMAKKGAPTGVMVGTTAIATGRFGEGRVVCFSPHPEKTPGLESFIRRGVRWAAGRESSAAP